MERATFMELEYQELRQEIRVVRDRLIKLAISSFVILPAAHSLAHFYKITPLLMFLPVLIVALMLLYFTESRALMRLGSYIKLEIENKIDVTKETDSKGWEHWLSENNGSRRHVDKLLALFFYVIFIFYYIIASYLSTKYIGESHNITIYSIAIGIYAFIGCYALYEMVRNYKHSVNTIQY